MALPSGAQAAITTDRITVMYRRESETAPTRLDPAVQASLLALDEAFLSSGFKVLQPSAEMYRVMDQGQAVIVQFADDAGFSMVLSAYRTIRPTPGSDSGIAEVTLQARVFVGRHVIAAEEGRGQMYAVFEGGQKEFGERRAYQLAARRASQELCSSVVARLKAMSPSEINQLLASAPSLSTVVTQVPLPTLSPSPPTPAPLDAPVPAVAAQSSAPAAAQVNLAQLPTVGLKFALLVGVSDYPSTSGSTARIQNALPGVRKDIENMKLKLLSMGWQKKRVISLLDEKASSTNVRSWLKEFKGAAKKDDMVLLYVSGHGADKEESLSGYGRPILSDDGGKGDSLDFWEIQSLIGNMDCERTVLIIDTCHAGNAAGGLITAVIGADGVTAAPSSTGPDGRVMARKGDPNKHLAIITAAKGNEFSRDTPNGGLFTLAFLDGLAKTKNRGALEQVMQVAAPIVVQETREACRLTGSNCKYPQQTPEIHYTGLGNQIVL